ncbi:hypothetical protein AB0M95_20975 [Sphaerisporangium sp. NPDC051017]|uniref:hypothetical protein n=1 Tax=Sphaerisporangium sp. NPDC051017 TaxID=3154636 RepID=UPI003423FEB6
MNRDCIDRNGVTADSVNRDGVDKDGVSKDEGGGAPVRGRHRSGAAATQVRPRRWDAAKRASADSPVKTVWARWCLPS